jgi:alkylhydroperoxidase family enzyme
MSEFLFTLGAGINLGMIWESHMNQKSNQIPDERFPPPVQDTPFLPPIEKPSGLMMKMVYYFSRRQIGEKFTPIKVFAARLPPAFGQLYGKIYSLDKKLTLPHEIAMLIRARVAQINVCPYCIDYNRYYAINALMKEDKWIELEDYNISPLFSEAERAALDYVTELTEKKKVSPTTFAHLGRFYSERAICEIVYLVASEHVANLTNIGLNIHSDELCQIVRKK